ncbi:hypothetical protein L208DRAFT_1391477 [Tricholoma matsutake]|nr:hypothetical protein L208DRAFT_1391477 [Tricholoma matsutake 945]
MDYPYSLGNRQKRQRVAPDRPLKCRGEIILLRMRNDRRHHSSQQLRGIGLALSVTFSVVVFLFSRVPRGSVVNFGVERLSVPAAACLLPCLSPYVYW